MNGLALHRYAIGGQPVTWSSSRTSRTPRAIHAVLTTASCSAQVARLADRRQSSRRSTVPFTLMRLLFPGVAGEAEAR